MKEAEKLLETKGHDYGFLGKNFINAADITSIMRGKKFHPLDVCACLIGIKISRIGNLTDKKAKHEKIEETVVDLINYPALFGELMEVTEVDTKAMEFIDKIKKDLNPFPCHACEERKEGILIRGLCKDCAPGLHKRHDCDMRFMAKMNAEFKEETGKDSLEDWHAFEDWLAKK